MAITIKGFRTKYIEPCDADIIISRYPNGRIALRLYDSATKMPLLTATTNIVYEPLQINEVMIKTWSENVGVQECLEDAGIIGPQKRIIHTGFKNECIASVHDLLAEQDSEYALHINKAIKLFCKAWLEWIDAGTPHEKIMFSTHLGMCDNLPYWMMENGYGVADRFAALEIMSREFQSRYGSKSYPFGGSFAYHNDKHDGTMHRNEARLAWAREKAAMLEKENVS